ncbi:hypothetical protein HN587_00930 [Candidatus Woesearchaeota archaeon]|jgi:hypothetical protein|nr:hypothetical protein [Candidatus Woesearchaeota archaeon]
MGNLLRVYETDNNVFVTNEQNEIIDSFGSFDICEGDHLAELVSESKRIYEKTEVVAFEERYSKEVYRPGSDMVITKIPFDEPRFMLSSKQSFQKFSVKFVSLYPEEYMGHIARRYITLESALRTE